MHSIGNQDTADRRRLLDCILDLETVLTRRSHLCVSAVHRVAASTVNRRAGFRIPNHVRPDRVVPYGLYEPAERIGDILARNDAMVGNVDDSRTG